MKPSTITKKIASLLALFIGVMSVFAGSKVLLGLEGKPYTILNWLVVYNVILGAISILTAVFIWANHSWFKRLIVLILSAHFLVLFYLYFFDATVATESIKAMLFRVGIWGLIFVLAFYPKKNKKSETQNPETL